MGMIFQVIDLTGCANDKLTMIFDHF